jgi:hypothetical protein
VVLILKKALWLVGLRVSSSARARCTMPGSMLVLPSYLTPETTAVASPLVVVPREGVWSWMPELPREAAVTVVVPLRQIQDPSSSTLGSQSTRVWWLTQE